MQQTHESDLYLGPMVRAERKLVSLTTQHPVLKEYDEADE